MYGIEENCKCEYTRDANDPPWSNTLYLYKVARDCPIHGEKCIHGFMPGQCEYNLCEQYMGDKKLADKKI